MPPAALSTSQTGTIRCHRVPSKLQPSAEGEWRVDVHAKTCRSLAGSLVVVFWVHGFLWKVSVQGAWAAGREAARRRPPEDRSRRPVRTPREWQSRGIAADL